VVKIKKPLVEPPEWSIQFENFIEPRIVSAVPMDCIRCIHGLYPLPKVSSGCKSFLVLTGEAQRSPGKWM
jgi:hypothetical protein